MRERLLDTVIPSFDVVMRHCVSVNAETCLVYALARRMPLMQTHLARQLLALRALPARLDRNGSPEDDSVFVSLKEISGCEVVFGFAGKFWHPSRNITRLGDAESWINYAVAGSAKAAVGIWVEPGGSRSSRLCTETRVVCFGANSRRYFKLYWRAAGPFSSLIREDWLRVVKRSSESPGLASAAETRK